MHDDINSTYDAKISLFLNATDVANP